jgi:hypothetical protein
MTEEIREFVIQQHTTPEGLHWDFMLREGEILQTFRLDGPPEKALEQPLNAEKIHDHPLRFLTYQGPVNQGRGKVRLVESGTYTIKEKTDSRTKLSMNGRILQGHFLLSHIKNNHWLFEKIENKKEM